MKRADVGSQQCSIARSMAILGDTWSVLILREAFLGRRRFADFVANTGATPSVVSDRLKRLVDAGILAQHDYQDHPPRRDYRLTAKGKELQPVLITLSQWGDKHLAGDDGPPVIYTHTTKGHDAEPTLVCGCCGDVLDHTVIGARRGPGLTRHRRGLDGSDEK